MNRPPPNVTGLPPSVAQHTLNQWSSQGSGAGDASLQALAFLLAQGSASNTPPANPAQPPPAAAPSGKPILGIVIAIFALLLPIILFVL